MSRIKEIKRQLEAAREAIDALDARLSAGELGSEDHARQRAELERETGRLFVDLRRAQRDADRPPERRAAPHAPSGLERLRNPVTMLVAAGVLVVAGIGGGLAVGRWLSGAPGPAAPGGAPGGAPADSPAVMGALELQALRQAAAREDAPTPALLQLAHLELDQGRLADARRVYERVLAREPRNVEAITHIGGVLYGEGRLDEALAKLEEALRIDPRYIHAHWDRTQYLFHGKRDFAATIKAAEAFLAVLPEGPDADNVRKLMAEARQRAGTGAAPKAR